MVSYKQSSAVKIKAPDFSDDPAWQAAMRAPIDDSPETEQERRDVEEVKAGARLVHGSQVTAEIAARAAREAE